MVMKKSPLFVALGAVVVLGACTDPSQLGNPDNPNRNANQGALIGATSGAVLGALIGGDREGAVIGAVVGGAAGAGIGYNLDRQEAELRRDLDSNGVRIVNTGDRLIVTLPNDILFAVNSTTVRSDLRSDLAVLAGSMQDYPNSTIQIVGHADSDGDAGYNQTLSEGRANAVANVLASNGVSFNRIQAFGRGESQPVASNLTAEGKAQNRRVDIVILPNA
ncbi:OmpA family protein [uncultured Tateyamaria sp.]|uniref:OmpA family protein n=1 Tax=uncultured Tateyamaria sp. TaxID=455651 RepID=UPI002628ED2C|nr:OmpA family protein [uncultured Tateyamaria sp.]